MPSPVTLAEWAGFLLFGGFFGVVFWKMATGSVPLGQLLETGGPTSSSSASRAQSLAVTLFVAFYYLIHLIQNPKQFPELPGALMALVVGSQSIYLGAKALDLLSQSWRNSFK